MIPPIRSTLRSGPRAATRRRRTGSLVAPLAGLASAALALGASGCATVRTLDGPLTDGRPLVMSGTRANLAELRRWELAANGPGPAAVAPPVGPLADLLPSAVLDFLVLGFTAPTAAVLVVASVLGDD